MKKYPSNPKYIKAEVPTPRVRIGPIIKEVIRIEVVGLTVDRGQYGDNRCRQNYRDNIF